MTVCVCVSSDRSQTQMNSAAGPVESPSQQLKRRTPPVPLVRRGLDAYARNAAASSRIATAEVVGSSTATAADGRLAVSHADAVNRTYKIPSVVNFDARLRFSPLPGSMQPVNDTVDILHDLVTPALRLACDDILARLSTVHLSTVNDRLLPPNKAAQNATPATRQSIQGKKSRATRFTATGHSASSPTAASAVVATSSSTSAVNSSVFNIFTAPVELCAGPVADENGVSMSHDLRSFELLHMDEVDRDVVFMREMMRSAPGLGGVLPPDDDESLPIAAMETDASLTWEDVAEDCQRWFERMDESYEVQQDVDDPRIVKPRHTRLHQGDDGADEAKRCFVAAMARLTQQRQREEQLHHDLIMGTASSRKRARTIVNASPSTPSDAFSSVLDAAVRDLAEDYRNAIVPLLQYTRPSSLFVSHSSHLESFPALKAHARAMMKVMVQASKETQGVLPDELDFDQMVADSYPNWPVSRLIPGFGCEGVQLYIKIGLCVTTLHDEIANARACFDEETRVLTSMGFLFGREIAALLADDTPLLFACYDRASKQLIYRPCVGNKLSVDFELSPELIDFTSTTERQQWEDGSGDYANDGVDSNGVSLRVTPNHTMYAHWGNVDNPQATQFTSNVTDGTPLRADFFVHDQIPTTAVVELSDTTENHDRHDKKQHGHKSCSPKGGLFVDSDAASEVTSRGLRFLARAHHGVQRDRQLREELDTIFTSLGLTPCQACFTQSEHPPRDEDQSDDPPTCQVLAFLELYGFWLSDGSMSFGCYGKMLPYVTFNQFDRKAQLSTRSFKSDSSDWLQKQLLACGLQPHEWVMDPTLPNGLRCTRICRPSWAQYLYSLYWLKYDPDRHFLCVELGESMDTEEEHQENDTALSVQCSIDELERSLLTREFSVSATESSTIPTVSAVQSLIVLPNPFNAVSDLARGIDGRLAQKHIDAGRSKQVMCTFTYAYVSSRSKGNAKYAPWKPGMSCDVVVHLNDPEHEMFGMSFYGPGTKNLPNRRAKSMHAMEYAWSEALDGTPITRDMGIVVTYRNPTVCSSGSDLTYEAIWRSSMTATLRAGTSVIVACGPSVCGTREKFDEAAGAMRPVGCGWRQFGANSDIRHIGSLIVYIVQHDDGIPTRSGASRAYIIEVEHPAAGKSNELAAAFALSGHLLSVREDDNISSDQLETMIARVDALINRKMRLPFIKSGKWFAPWVNSHLNQEQLRWLIRGLWRADGSLGDQNPHIHTYSFRFRDEIQVAALHAGYTVQIMITPHGNPGSECVVQGHRINSQHDYWVVHFSDSVSTEAPTLFCQSDVKRVPYNGRVWCISVEHPDHLVVAQRAFRNSKGVVTKQSRPIITGQCNVMTRSSRGVALWVGVNAHDLSMEFSKNEIRALMAETHVGALIGAFVKRNVKFTYRVQTPGMTILSPCGTGAMHFVVTVGSYVEQLAINLTTTASAIRSGLEFWSRSTEVDENSFLSTFANFPALWLQRNGVDLGLSKELEALERLCAFARAKPVSVEWRNWGLGSSAPALTCARCKDSREVDVPRAILSVRLRGLCIGCFIDQEPNAPPFDRRWK